MRRRIRLSAENTAPVKLLESLREAVSGGSPMSPEVARRVVLLFRKFNPPEQADYDLTPHESRLLRLLAEGHSYRGAAVELGLSGALSAQNYLNGW